MLALATLHDVAPLLYERLANDASPANVPGDVLQRLREIYLMTGARNALLYRELGPVLQALQHDNIPVIVLKGAHLAALVYRHIALRPMSDIDLLVHRSDLERAVAKLHDLGFTGPLAGEVPDGLSGRPPPPHDAQRRQRRGSRCTGPLFGRPV